MNTAPCENVHDEEQRSKYYYVVFPSAFFYYRQNNNLHLRGHISHMDTKNTQIFYVRQRNNVLLLASKHISRLNIEMSYF